MPGRTVAELESLLAEARRALAERERDLAERDEQQAAIAAVLRAIGRSPPDLQGVLDAIADSAARMCDAASVRIFLVEDGLFQAVGGTDSVGNRHTLRAPGRTRPLDRGTLVGRSIVDREIVHVPDMREVPRGEIVQTTPSVNWARSDLLVPLLSGERALGTISVSRHEVRPFTDRQIALLETFADQAVIAIENARLVSELQERLEEQTATGELLRVIASSPTEQEAVLDEIARTAARLLGAEAGSIQQRRGNFLVNVGNYATEELEARIRVVRERRLARGEQGQKATRGSVSGRAFFDGRTIGVADHAGEETLREYPDAREAQALVGFRSHAATPLMLRSEPIGVLFVHRFEVKPFAERELRLLETFADQAVIAIENARLFRELAAKSAQLEEASRHKSEFLANMSHELRTPLNAVIGFTEVLLERYFGEINAKQEEYLRDVLSSGQHLLSLINDILDLSKVEAGRMELELGTFDLAEALEAGLVMVKEHASRKGLELALDAPDDLGRVEADERKVKQIVFNLLSNAVKFTPAGGKVTVSARRGDGRVELAVADTGVGIAPEEQGRVFEEFGQARSASGQSEGTGLGLALVKRYVELHGGEVAVESAVGKGSTFTVALPARQPGRA